MQTPRFKNVSCSQCGVDFGPGEHGFSHCDNHQGMSMQTNDSGHVAVPAESADTSYRVVLPARVIDAIMSSVGLPNADMPNQDALERLVLATRNEVLARLPAKPDTTADARDAARYRWLRDSANKVLDRAPIVVMADVEFHVGFGDIRTGPRLDGEIDAELAKAGVNN